ncbi:MAG: riboflavin synthase [Cyanobacteria bacterium J06632_3]
MFTGLVQSVGRLQRLTPYQLKITCQTAQDSVMQDIALGDSIAVDGVCLTVEKILTKGFIAAASPETLAKSTLGTVAENGKVNLEPSLRVGSKIGGHFVTGHVDGTGQLERAEQTANAWEITFCQVSPRVARYIVNKGSIAVNGISLTVADCNLSGDWFSTAVIPVTYAETNLQYLRPGDLVNLEGDVLGKSVEKFARYGASQAAGKEHTEQNGAAQNSETMMDLGREQKSASVDTAIGDPSLAFLAEHGYL